MDILHSSSESLKSGLREGKITIAVYGLGHVGLAISAVWLRAGGKVIGVDVKEEVIKSINNGVSPIKDEPGIPETIKKSLAEGKLEATVDGVKASRESDVKIIAVPVTLTNTKNSDLSALKQALQTIAGGLKKGDLVIIESSVPPTTTATVAKAILEKTSRLRVEEDFGLTYSPERIYEGRALEDIEKRYPKVAGGIGPRSTEAAAALYEVIVQKGVIRTTSPAVAETSKLFEGIYRDANIALANELARFCGTIDIDFNEVRAVANSQPFCNLHLPGFVGGWCIPFYPHFVLQVANEKNIKLPLTSLARKINEDKPKVLIKVADSTLKEVSGKGLKASRVAILGLTFRGDTSDTRNSPSYEAIDLLLRRGVSTINAYDPYVSRDINLEKKGIHLAPSISEATKDTELIIIMTDHSSFKNHLTPNEVLKTASTPAVLIDGRNILPISNGGTATDNFAHRKIEGFSVFIRSTEAGKR
nr:nucleotide sugar dehydrogenase [Candidatus Njordarchaeota archaeon]